MAEATEVRFRPGDRVRVRDVAPEGHCRTPGYVRGHTGIVETFVGTFRNPESSAYGGDGLPLQPLYTVRFRQDEVWGDAGGARGDAVLVDLYQHWLEPARRAKEGKR